MGNLTTPYYSPEVLIPIIEKNTDFHLVVFSPSPSNGFSEAVAKAKVADRVTVLEEEHGRMLSILKGCDAGFLALQKDDPQGEYAIPSKFYDYLSCGIPVLVIADNTSFVHSFVRKHGNGIALTWAEEPDKDRAMLDIIEKPEYQSNARKILPMVMDEFDRSKANQVLVDRIIGLGKVTVQMPRTLSPSGLR